MGPREITDEEVEAAYDAHVKALTIARDVAAAVQVGKRPKGDKVAAMTLLEKTEREYLQAVIKQGERNVRTAASILGAPVEWGK